MILGHRTQAAAILIAAAIAVPCCAWYWLGSQEARREARSTLDGPRLEAENEASRMADQLAVRLEALRQVESRRPFFHYQSHYHDPFSDCECSSVTPSPLSQGPGDPLVWTYFQIDPLGQMTLPTLNEEMHQEGGGAWLDRQATILGRLIPAAPVFMTSVTGDSSLPADGSIPPGWRRETVGEDSWVLNMEICGIRNDPLAVTVAAAQQKSHTVASAAGRGAVDVLVTPFTWSMVVLAGNSSLVGLRRVISPLGIFLQGFVLDPERVAETLAGAAFPARWVPGDPEGDATAPVALAGVRWHVAVESSTALAAATARSDSILSRFHRLFLAGTLAALLAGISVVALVWQSERLARQRARFAASAAHELRTPLSGIRMYGEMLAHHLGDPEKSRRYAAHISQEADRLGRVVSNVMNYTRLERGEFAVHRRPGDLAEAVREATDAIRPIVESAGAELVLDIETGLPEVLFDRDAIHQMLHNLVDNAVKYAAGSDDRKVTVSLERRGPQIALHVRDRGPGVDDAVRGRLFKPFHRGDGVGEQAGLGLGLTLVRALAHAHEAKIDYRDAPGGGADFMVAFPAAAMA